MLILTADDLKLMICVLQTVVVSFIISHQKIHFEAKLSVLICHNLTDPLVSDVYSFEEEEAVLDPHISEHLSHFGIDMLQMQKKVSQAGFTIHFCISTIQPRAKNQNVLL